MIIECTDDIFSLDVESIVNPVNCVGIMGAGLALKFKERYPQNYKAYKAVCENKLLKAGDIFVTKISNNGVKYVINFATKDHYKNHSKINYITEGLIALKQFLDKENISSVAIPALGCGLGGLNYPEVKDKILKEFDNTEKNVYVIAPK